MESNHSRTVFISTALPYVNAAPHLGFALELVQADVLARAHRLGGDDVCFVSGTDEHSLKNVLAAERAGEDVASFVARHAQHFRALASALDVHTDAFVRTSGDAAHAITVRDALTRLEARGDLYKASYRGLYCVGCEQFYEPGELTEDFCVEHASPLEPSEEENWFFRLSRYRQRLLDALDDVVIVPDAARAESRRFLEGELRDLCISRKASRARGFGIPVPFDPEQVVYVWFDALLGYLTALGGERARYWNGSRRRIHVLGKGIVRFHTVHWLALLLALDEPLPTHVLVHGYLTFGGEKISKSRASLDPHPLLHELGSDAVRYYLLRHVRTTRDGDFDRERLERAYDAELANQLGNLTSRSCGLIVRFAAGHVQPLDSGDSELLAQADALSTQVRALIERFELDRGLELIFDVVRAANTYVDRTAPWKLAASGSRARLDTVLATLVHVLRQVAEALAPFLPGASTTILAALREGKLVTQPAPLFPRRSTSGVERRG